MIIPIKIKLFLRSDLGERTIVLDSSSGEVEFQGKQSKQIEIESFVGQDEIRLCGFTGFVAGPGPHIIIDRLEINDYEVNDYYSILSFRMNDNQYVENKLLEGLDQITFNGDLVIRLTDKIKDRLIWFPTTYSNIRNDMVYMNSILNCQNPIGCFGIDQGCIHEPPYKLFNQQEKDYDIIALGCSFTAGSGITKNKAWPSLLTDRGHRTLNLGVPGGGIDTIFTNLKNLIKKQFKFKRILILLPEVGTRRLYTIKKHDLYFHLITSGAEAMQFPQGEFNIFFMKNELDKIYKDKHREMILSASPERDTKIIKRMVSFLYNNQIDFAISSWGGLTYEILKENIGTDRLLPMFNEEMDTSVGKDGKHPAEPIHEKWIKSIEHLI